MRITNTGAHGDLDVPALADLIPGGAWAAKATYDVPDDVAADLLADAALFIQATKTTKTTEETP